MLYETLKPRRTLIKTLLEMKHTCWQLAFSPNTKCLQLPQKKKPYHPNKKYIIYGVSVSPFNLNKSRILLSPTELLAFKEIVFTR